MNHLKAEKEEGMAVLRVWTTTKMTGVQRCCKDQICYSRLRFIQVNQGKRRQGKKKTRQEVNQGKRQALRPLPNSPCLARQTRAAVMEPEGKEHIIPLQVVVRNTESRSQEKSSSHYTKALGNNNRAKTCCQTIGTPRLRHGEQRRVLHLAPSLWK